MTGAKNSNPGLIVVIAIFLVPVIAYLAVYYKRPASLAEYCAYWSSPDPAQRGEQVPAEFSGQSSSQSEGYNYLGFRQCLASHGMSEEAITKLGDFPSIHPISSRVDYTRWK